MGFTEKRITITGVRSSHNSLQDKLDEVKWKYLRDRIDAIILTEGLESLNIVVSGPS